MEDAKKLLGSVTIPKEIIEEVDSQVKDIAIFKKKIAPDIPQRRKKGKRAGTNLSGPD